MIGDLAPEQVRLTDVLFGEVWARPSLSQRDRSLITVTTLIALYRTDQLGFHLSKSLESRLSQDPDSYAANETITTSATRHAETTHT